jgi:hypothetical protein
MFRTSNLAHDRVTVRRAHYGDEAALADLAALDSTRLPEGPMLVAEADSRVLAALPLGSGRPIADPFVPSAHLVELLRMRAEQIEHKPARRGFRWLARELFRTKPALD